MKRLRVDETAVKDVSGHPQPVLSTNPTFAGRSLPATVGSVHRQVLATTQAHNSTSTIAYSTSGGVKVVEPPGGMQSGLYSTSAVSYSTGAMPSATAPHASKPQVVHPLPISQHGQLRNKVTLKLENLFNLIHLTSGLLKIVFFLLSKLLVIIQYLI